MIAAWMLYCIGIAVAFVVVGEALERALHLARRATRWAWIAALAGSYVVPAAAWLRPSAFGALPVPLAQPVATGPITLPQLRSALPPPKRSFSLGDLDAGLTWAWGLSSAVLLVSLGAAAVRLAALRRGWRNATVDGRVVLVSDNMGPALVGLWRSQVVLPEWALRLGAGERRLMLAHEEEHVRARDPWLLAAAAGSVVLAPWNAVLWWQVRRLRLAVEMDCDARVLARGGDTPEYAELLLRVGQRRARLPLGAPALGEPVSFLGRRIRRMVTDLPRWRWAGATAAGCIAAAAVIAACEAPRPVGLRAASDASAVVEPAPGPYSPSAAYLERLAHQYHPEVFAHPLRRAAVAFVFDAQDRVIGHATGVREPRDGDCLAVVDRLVPAFQANELSSGGCADTAYRGAVIVYWKKLKQALGPGDVSTQSMVDERPVFLSGPPLQYPALLRQAGIQGRVLVRAIIDTTGRAEPASVRVVESPHPGFDQAAKNAVLQARFRHGRFRGRAVRVLIEFPVEFRTQG
jgi:bla regulator protein blaR1